MELYLNQILRYLIHVLLASSGQLFILFGPLLVLALFLNYSAGLTARLSVRFWGRNIFMYGFVWLGCSVHELSHAFFALIFGHKIKEIELFKPNSDGESIGHVSHSYNKRSIYQKTGNFFIGIGPLLAGGIVLFLATLLIFHIQVTEIFKFRITTALFSDKIIFNQFINSLWSGLQDCIRLVLAGNSINWWKSGLFIYVLYSTGSSMTLSKSDVKGAIAGLIWVVVFVLIFNLLTLWISDFATKGVAGITQYISAFYFLLLLSFLSNLLFILLFLVLNGIKSIFISR